MSTIPHPRPSDNLNADAADPVDAFYAHLHRGSRWNIFFDNDAHFTRWIPGDKPYTLPSGWRTGRNVYSNIHGCGEKSKRRCGSTTNATVNALNCFYAEFDGKDFVRQDEWHPLYQTPDLTDLTPARQRGALQRAQTAAIDAAYKLNPEEYRGRAMTHILSLRPRPSAVWDSGGGYQATWHFDDTVMVDDTNRKLIAHYQREWVHAVEGDPSACDLRRVLRTIGTQNVKPKYAPNYPTVAFVWCELDRLYRYDELIAPLPPPKQPTRTQRKPTHIPEGVTLPKEAAELPSLPAEPAVRYYNGQHNLREELLDLGYTEAASRRLSRPGGDSGGVELHSDNSATIYSSNDLLFCGRRVRPADVLCAYAYEGDAERTLDHLRREFAAAKQATKAMLYAYLLWLRSPDSDCRAMVKERAELIGRTHTRIERVIRPLQALAEICLEENTLSPTPGLRRWGEKCNASYGSMFRAAKTLSRLGFISATGADGTPFGEGGKEAPSESGEPAKRTKLPAALRITILLPESVLEGRYHEIFHNRNSSTENAPVNTVTVMKNPEVTVLETCRAHLADHAFLDNHRFYNERYPDRLKPLGINALPVVALLATGPHEPAAIRAVLRISNGSLYAILHRLHQYGMTRYEDKRVELLPEALTLVLDLLRDNMNTIGVLERRLRNNAKDRLALAVHDPACPEGRIQYLQARYDRLDALVKQIDRETDAQPITPNSYTEAQRGLLERERWSSHLAELSADWRTQQTPRRSRHALARVAAIVEERVKTAIPPAPEALAALSVAAEAPLNQAELAAVNVFDRAELRLKLQTHWTILTNLTPAYTQAHPDVGRAQGALFQALMLLDGGANKEDEDTIPTFRYVPSQPAGRQAVAA